MHEQIPQGADLDYYRKRAKELARSHRRGDPEARVRAARALGERDRFVLADALHVIAREHGLRSWPELKRAVEASTTTGAELSALPDGADELVPFDLTYADGEAVRVRVRRRANRVDVDDRGEAVERSRRPQGWLAVAEAVVERHNLNVNRRGVVFVPAVVGRDIDSLARRVAEASVAVHGALLELEDQPGARSRSSTSS
jgi:hypothetical protein